MNHPSRSSRRRLTAIGLLPILLLATLGSGCRKDSPPSIVVLGFDGLDPEAMDLLLSEGKLPNFAKLRREGAYGRLETFRPTLSPILWTTIATGKTPDQHGIGHFVATDPETGREEPVTSDMRRVRALWNIFSTEGRTVGTLGWWATHPPEVVNGFVASDRMAWHFLFAEGFENGGSSGGATFPPELEARLRPMMTRPDQIGLAALAPHVEVVAADLERPFDLDDDLQHFRWVLATLRSYRDLGLSLWGSERPDLMMVYFEGTDSVAHLFGHLFRADGLHGSRSDLFVWHRYYIPSYLMAALLAGFGAQAVADRAPRRARLLLLALPLTQLLLGYRQHDRSGYRIAEDYSRRLLASLPPGADLIASDDNILFVLLYLKHVEGLRPDITLVAQGVGAAELPPLRIDPLASRLYFTHHPNWQLPELEVVPEGLTFHVRGSRRAFLPRADCRAGHHGDPSCRVRNGGLPSQARATRPVVSLSSGF